MSDSNEQANQEGASREGAVFEQHPPASPAESADAAPLSFWEMLTSTLWAVLGVQNSKNRERDFSRGKAIHFIYFGIGFTVVFVIGMILLVKLVLSQVG